VKRVFAWAVAAAALFFVPGGWAQGDLTDIPEPDIEDELAAFHLAGGFEINLFAADPDVINPIQMNWDEQGRMWVTGSAIYPQIKPGQKPNDKIVVLEDADGDGRADKRTVFAEGLLIPTAVLPGGGGAYAANAEELLHLKDTDGDGKADERTILLSGFGTEDVHHMIHTFRWGPGGRLYFNQSIYTHSHVETPWGVKRLRAGGVWRLDPRSLRMEIFARGGINPWGLHYDRWGQFFLTDGAYTEGINYVFPGAALVAADGVERILRGLNPGQPKHCGLEVLSGRHLPGKWRGNLLTADYRGNRVNRFILSESGSGFASRQAEDLVWSEHVSFRPVDIKMGPDGAIYIADWYNPIIQHGEVDFRDPRRDHSHGRIWRITAKDRPLVDPPELAGASVEELLAALKLPEGWTRAQARRLLKERGPEEVLPALEEFVASVDPLKPPSEHHRLEALWVHQSLNAVNEQLLGMVLASSDARARAAAVRVLRDWLDEVVHPDQLLAGALIDEAPRVRLEAVHALRKREDAHSARMALAALDSPTDRYIEYALALTLEELAPYWLSRVQEDPYYLGGDIRKLLFALKSVPDAGVGPLVELYQAGEVPAEHEEEAVDLIAARGGPAELEVVFRLALEDGSAAERRAALLGLLAEAAADRDVAPSGDLARVTRLLESADEAVRRAAARLAGRWRVEEARGKLVALARSDEAGTGLRRAAMDSLALLGGGESIASLAELAGKESSLETRTAAAAALASLDLEKAAEKTVPILQDIERPGQAEAVFDALIERQDGPDALARALEGEDLPNEAALYGLRKLGMSGLSSPDLEKALEQAGGAVRAPLELDEQQMEELIAEVKEQGDPERGEAIYRRESQACLQCHAIGGAGGRLGPDLSSIGTSAPVDYLIDALLRPSKQIKEGFHGVIVRRKDGSVVSGIVERSDEDEMVLRDASDHRIAIPVEQIEEDRVSPSSLMPPTPASLRRDELVDLTRFLAELGKGDYRVSAKPLVRRWRVLNTEGNPFRSTLLRKGLRYALANPEGDDWKPAYSLVSGKLPLEDIPRMPAYGNRELSFARFEVSVSTPGKIGLRLNSAAGLKMWVNELEQGEVSREVEVELGRGNHWITVSVDHDERAGAPLRVELVEAEGSPAAAQLVTGR